MGYFSYDYLGYSEPAVRTRVEDSEAFKDVDLMLFDKVIAFDNFRQKIILIVNMSLEDPETGYNKAVLELDNIPGVGMLRITGRVVRCVKVDAAGDNVFHVGFQFLDLSRQHQNRLVKFIFDIQRQSLAKGIGKK